jgi:hypothetical protein
MHHRGHVGDKRDQITATGRYRPKRQFSRDMAPVSGYLMAPRRERRYKPLPMMQAPLYCTGATSSDRFTTNHESDKAYL